MFPYVAIFGYTFSVYGLMTALGVIVCVIYLITQRKHWVYADLNMELMLLSGCIGAFLGSKILYWVTAYPEFTSDLSYLFANIGSGFVFYGGFYGAVGAAALYAHVRHMDIWEVSKSAMPCVPLFHIFGRIGCFAEGCCYGVKSDTFGIAFSRSDVAPNGIPLLPVQLIEATCELVLFVILWQWSHRENSGKVMFGFWLITYSCIRFILEFFRGDEYRGFIGPLSVSQVIAVISVLFGIAVLVTRRSVEDKKGAIDDGERDI